MTSPLRSAPLAGFVCPIGFSCPNALGCLTASFERCSTILGTATMRKMLQRAICSQPLGSTRSMDGIHSLGDCGWGRVLECKSFLCIHREGDVRRRR